jgi:hypothetical protein
MDIREAVVVLIENRDANLHSAVAHQRNVETPSAHVKALRNDPLGDDTVEIREGGNCANQKPP